MSEKKLPWRCRLGLHNWKYGLENLIDEVRTCKRCKRKEVLGFNLEFHVIKEVKRE